MTHRIRNGASRCGQAGAGFSFVIVKAGTVDRRGVPCLKDRTAFGEATVAVDRGVAGELGIDDAQTEGAAAINGAAKKSSLIITEVCAGDA